MSSDREQIKLRFPLRLPPIVHKRGWNSNYWSYTKKSDINKCFHKKQLTPLLSRGHTTFHERRMSSGAHAWALTPTSDGWKWKNEFTSFGICCSLWTSGMPIGPFPLNTMIRRVVKFPAPAIITSSFLLMFLPTVHLSALTPHPHIPTVRRREL